MSTDAGFAKMPWAGGTAGMSDGPEDSADERMAQEDTARSSDRDGAPLASADAHPNGVADAGGDTFARSYHPCPATAGPCVIMPLGDSITWGYGSTSGGGYRVELFADAVANHKTITFVGSSSTGPTTVSGMPFPMGNEGHSGYTIDDRGALKGITPLVDMAIATYKPHIVLLTIGTNDIANNVDLPNAPVRLGELIDKIIADSPETLVVVAQIIPTKNADKNSKTVTFNAAIPGIVEQRASHGGHVQLVDVFSAFNTVANYQSALLKDTVHPNDSGYAIMGKTWYRAIESVLP